MKTVEAQGYSKEKALEATGLEVEMEQLKNATIAWKKAGSPMGDKALKTFMTNYIKEKKVVGAYIVVESASDDTRTRPYTVYNEVTHGKRKATTFYQIKEGEFKVKFNKVSKEVEDENGNVNLVEEEVPVITVLSTGLIVDKAEKKDEAFRTAKDLTAETGKDYVIEIVREITTGQKYAGYVKYTPSKSAKEGKFMFFVRE